MTTSSRAAIACLGAGRLGRGIAVAFAYAGHRVTLIDVKPRSAEQFTRLVGEALGEVRQTLASLARFGLLSEDDATVIVGPGMTEFGPAFVCVLQVQTDRDTAGGRAS